MSYGIEKVIYSGVALGIIIILSHNIVSIIITSYIYVSNKQILNLKGRMFGRELKTLS